MQILVCVCKHFYVYDSLFKQLNSHLTLPLLFLTLIQAKCFEYLLFIYI